MLRIAALRWWFVSFGSFQYRQLAAVRLLPGPGRESDVVHRLRLNTMQRPGHTGRRRSRKKKAWNQLYRFWELSSWFGKQLDVGRYFATFENFSMKALFAFMVVGTNFVGFFWEEFKNTFQANLTLRLETFQWKFWKLSLPLKPLL